MNKLSKSVLIGVGALILSTVAIQASDSFRGVKGNLAGLAIDSTSVCDSGSVQILLGSHALCVDTFEASPSPQCPHSNPQSQTDTQDNANQADCVAQSKQGVMPWRFISLTQAQQFCARVSKRLPTNEEWYKTVSGQADQSACVINSKKSEPETTGSTQCVTPAGVHDMIGNVWEWMDGEVQDGNYNNRSLPETGFVSLVDADGIVAKTTKTAVDEYGQDYAWTAKAGLRGIIRGGFYGSGSDAGIFAQNLSVPLDFRSTGVGFRCVKDL